MADKKISELELISSIATDDVAAIVDVTGNITYKFTFEQLLTFIAANAVLGAAVSFGTASPSGGKDGDVYIKTNSNQFYQRIAGTWTVFYTIVQGVVGNQVYFANANPVTAGNITGNEGDVYLCTANATFYKNTSTGSGTTWFPVYTIASGPAGPRGNSVLSGATDPVSGTGLNGDFYINTATNVLWGPKASGAWPGSGLSLAPLVPNTLRSGNGAPDNSLGINGDFYIDTVTFKWYGPKASGVWPAGIALGGGGGTSVGPEDIPIPAESDLPFTVNYQTSYASHGNKPKLEIFIVTNVQTDTPAAGQTTTTKRKIYDVPVDVIDVDGVIQTLLVYGHDSGDGATTIDDLILRIT